MTRIYNSCHTFKKLYNARIVNPRDRIGSSIPGFVGTVYGAVKTSITANEIIEHIFVIEENNE